MVFFNHLIKKVAWVKSKHEHNKYCEKSTQPPTHSDYPEEKVNKLEICVSRKAQKVNKCFCVGGFE